MIMFEEVMKERVSNSSVQTTRTLRQSSSPVCLTQECTKYREIILKWQYTVDNVLQFEMEAKKNLLGSEANIRYFENVLVK